MSSSYLLCLLMALVSIPAFGQPIGGPGFALRWDRRRPADIVSWVWETVPQTEGMTYEMWIKVLDPYVNFQVPFSFGVFDGTNQAIYSVPYEVSLYISPGFVSMWKVNKQADCGNASAMFDTWTHLAWTLDFTTGDLLIYQNAELRCTFAGFDPNPPRNNGLVSMGMEGASLEGSSYSDHSLFDGVMDEFRIWNGVRTQLEILNNYQHTLDVSAPENAKLNTYLNFDVPSLLMVDETETIVAQVGRLATYRQYIVQVTKPSGLPSAPVFVHSDCPIQGGLTVLLVDDNELTFYLPYHSGDLTNVAGSVEFSALNGTLTQDGSPIVGPLYFVENVSSPLQYTAVNGGNLSALQILDQIKYTLWGGDLVENVTGAIEFAWGVEPPPIGEMLSTAENELNFVMLGINTIRGSRLPIEIVNVTQGTLYELAFDPELVDTDVYFFANYQAAQMKIENLTAVTSFPYTINNGPGVILYNPPENYFGTSVAVHYRAVGDANILGLTVDVIHVNQPPIALGAQNGTHLVLKSLSNLTFSSVDIDTNYAPRPFYRIVDFPKFGTLFDPTQNMTAVPPEEQSQVFSWAKEVVAVSSVFPVCEGEDETNFRQCGDTGYGPLEALGPFNFFPKYGDSVNGYSPQFFGDENWAIFQITPMVLTSLEVFETVNPGGIIRVRASDRFTTVNDSLNWPLLWASEIAVPILPSEPFVFSPALCPSFLVAEYIRIDITAGRIGIGYNIDALRVTGTTSLNKGWLHGDTVTYRPAPGIHMNSSDVPLDKLSFVASDCEAVSHPPYVIPLFQPPESKVHNNNATLFVEKEAVMLSAVLDYDLLRLGRLIVLARDDLVARSVNIDGFIPRLELVSVDRSILISKQDNTSLLSFPFLLSSSEDNITVKFQDVAGYIYPVEMIVWVYHGPYVHRMSVLLTPQCMYFMGMFQPTTDSPCRLCRSVDLDEYLGMSAFERLSYDTHCPHLLDERVGPRTRSGLAVLTALCLLVAVVSVVWTIWHRHSRIVFFSGVEFLIATATGFSAAVLGSQLALSDQCYYPWLLHPGLALAFSCGLARNFRLDKLFNLKKLKSSWKIKGWYLGAFVMSVVVVDLLVLAISTSLHPVRKDTFGECLLSPVEEPILVGIELALALLGLYYAYRVRDVPSRFNESKWNSFVLANAVVLGVLAVCLETVLNLEYGEALVFRFTVYAWVSIAGLCATFFPKMVARHRNPLQRPMDIEAPKLSRLSSMLDKIKSEVSNKSSEPGDEFDLPVSRTDDKEKEESSPKGSEVEKLKEQLKRCNEEVKRVMTQRAEHDDKGKLLEKKHREAEAARFTVETEIEFLVKQRVS